MRSITQLIKWVSLSLVILLSGSLWMDGTGAYFSDQMYGVGSFNSGAVDIELEVDEPFDALPMQPGDSNTAKLLLSNLSLPVSYKLSLTPISGSNLCESLSSSLSYNYYDATDTLVSVTLYTGTLASIAEQLLDPNLKAIPNLLSYQTNPDYTDSQHWFSLEATMPASPDLSLQALSCSVSLVAEAWQAGQPELVGFTDSDSVVLSLSSGSWDICEPGTAYPEEVIADQGLRKNNTPVLAARSNPDSILGPADGVFFSLGFGGSLVAEFAAPIENGAGNDLILREVTNGRASYPEELAQVEVSQNGSDWVALGISSSKDAGGTTAFDLTSIGMPWIRFVKLTDISNPAIFASDGDGYDLDSIYGVYGTCQSQFPVCSQVAGRVLSDIDQSGLAGIQVGLKKPGMAMENIVVSATTPTPVESSVLVADRYYLVEVQGTWTNQNGVRRVDAAYYSDNIWSSWFSFRNAPPRDPRQLTLTIDNQYVDWGKYSSDHRYKTVIKGEGSSVALSIFDKDQDPNPPGWYNDNQGSLTVSIVDITDSIATTNEEGNYSFDACMPGIYQVVSIPDASWQLVEPQNYYHFTQASIPTSPDITLKSKVVLNEFLPDPIGSDDQDKPLGEWVELYSMASETISVGGWSLVSNAGNMVVDADSWDNDLFPLIENPLTIDSLEFGILYNTSGSEKLGNLTDTISLIDDQGRLRDRYSYNGVKPEGNSCVRNVNGTGSWIDPIPSLGLSNHSDQLPVGKFLRQDKQLLVGLSGLGSASNYLMSIFYTYGPEATMSGQLDVGGSLDRPYLWRNDFSFETCSDEVCVPHEEVEVTKVETWLNPDTTNQAIIMEPYE